VHPIGREIASMNMLVIGIVMAVIIPLVFHYWREIIYPNFRARRQADRLLAKRIRADKKKGFFHER
jgi:hypothetical protein